MIVDDRLDTVLQTAAATPAVARIRLRQLIDLLGRFAPAQALPRPALARLDELVASIGTTDVARLVRDEARSLRHPELVAHLALHDPAIAAAAIGTARLDDASWTALIPQLPLVARGLLRHRDDLGPGARRMLAHFGIGDLVLPQPPARIAEPVLAVSNPPPDPEFSEAQVGISALLRRIEAFRRHRMGGDRESAPRLPLSDNDSDPAPPRIAAVDVVLDSAGTCVWAGQGLGPSLVGTAMTGLAGSPLARAVRRQLPIRQAWIELAGADRISGQWRIDAAPRFDPRGGQFLGWRGSLRRPLHEAEPAALAETGYDRIRQLLHELRTPINAIQGFAELIQQQLFGPTPHRYRSLAATIAADAAHMLAGFEEIERLARIEGAAGEDLSGEADLAILARRTVDRLGRSAEARGVTLAIDAPEALPIAMTPDDAERMVWRLVATLSEAAGAGERVAITLSQGARSAAPLACLTLPLPDAMAILPDNAIFGIESGSAGSGAGGGFLGSGFALRLARAEARSVGGDLTRDGRKLVLQIPGLTPGAGVHSAPIEATN